MNPAFFTRITFADATLESQLVEYLDWAIGQGRFRRLRDGRLEMGVPRGLTVETLLGAGDFVGANDCSLAVRRSDERALLRLVHRDRNDGALLWHSHVRITAEAVGATIEHAMLRTGPRNVPLPPKASSPRIIEELIRIHGRGGIEPRDLYTPGTVCPDASSTEAFVEHIMLDRSRAVPIVVVTPAATSGTPVVDAGFLTRQLRGMAVVANLTTRESTATLADVLQGHRFARPFTCFDGGVRLYVPRMDPADPLHRHPLWIRSWLLDLSADGYDRTDLLAGIVAARIAGSAMPADLPTSIPEFDRLERRRLTDRLLAHHPAAPSTSSGPTAADIEDRDRKISDLEAALRDASAMAELYAEDNRRLEAGVRELEEKRSQLEYEAQTASLKAEALEQNLHNLKLERADQLPAELQSAIAGLLLDDLTPEMALRLVTSVWPDRVMALETAFRSARESEAFHQPAEVLALLTRLATSYYDALDGGRGDQEARKVFGQSEFAATESESVMSSKGAVRRRTFLYQGKPVAMFRHLKLGHRDSVSETMRIHFLWDSEARRIVIGHCGPHLNFS